MKTQIPASYHLLIFLLFTFTACTKESNEIYVAPDAPQARAGADQLISLPSNSITLDASGSRDAQYAITNYYWSQIEGYIVGTISHPRSATTTVQNLDLGSYKFKVMVTNSKGISASDTLNVKVDAGPFIGNEKIFTNRPWESNWYNMLEVPNIHDYFPAGTAFTVFVQRDNNASWVQATTLTQNPASGTYEFFIETQLNGGGGFRQGSLYVFYYGADIGDTPNIKLVL